MTNIKEISTDEVLNAIKDNNPIIIDARNSDSYNGWKCANEQRGGHIKGAKTLPLKWTNYMDWIEVVRSKQILPKHNIVIYSYSENESLKLANYFIKAGYSNVSIYKYFIEE